MRALSRRGCLGPPLWLKAVEGNYYAGFNEWKRVESEDADADMDGFWVRSNVPDLGSQSRMQDIR